MEGTRVSVHHRAVSPVTNKIQPRLSLAMFYGPNGDTVNGPIEDLIDEEHPALHRSYNYAVFLKSSTGKKEQEGFQLLLGKND